MAGGLRELHARLLAPLRMEFKIVQVSARRHGAGQRVRQRARARAALHHHAARPELQLQVTGDRRASTLHQPREIMMGEGNQQPPLF